MGLEGLREREHGVIDILMLLAIVGVAVVTWSCLPDAAAVRMWALYASVTISWILALAALTRRPHWSALIRFLTGGWMIAAPHLLGFTDIVAARWAYLLIGIIVALASIPGVAVVFSSRMQVAT